jgi:hypothetical protein
LREAAVEVGQREQHVLPGQSRRNSMRHGYALLPEPSVEGIRHPGAMSVNRSRSGGDLAYGVSVAHWARGLARDSRRARSPRRPANIRPQQSFNPSRARVGALPHVVLPEANHLPTAPSKRRGRGPVTAAVGLELRPPKNGVASRGSPVARTGVPETPVHEHRDAFSTKYEIWANGGVPPATSTASAADRLHRDPNVSPPTANSRSPKGAGEGDFRGGIATGFHAGHPLRSLFGGKDVRHDR